MKSLDPNRAATRSRPALAVSLALLAAGCPGSTSGTMTDALGPPADAAVPKEPIFDLATPDLAMPDLSIPDLSQPDLHPPPCVPSFLPVKTLVGDPGTSFAAIGRLGKNPSPDIVSVSESSNRVAVFLDDGNGTGGFLAPTYYDTGAGPEWVSIGDYNGDGLGDLVTADYYTRSSVSLFAGDAAGALGSRAVIPAGLNPQAVARGDFDGDGHADIVVSTFNDQTVTFLFGDGKGGLRETRKIPLGPKAPLQIGVAVGRFNNDPYDDAVFGSELSQIYVVLGGDAMGFPLKTSTIPIPAAALKVVVADFDGDRRMDVACTAGGSNIAGAPDIAVLLGDGAGGFANPRTWTVHGDAIDIAIADFNCDAIPDLVTANRAGMDASILLGTGDGGFRSAMHVGRFHQPFTIATGDLNGDGRPDLVVSNWDRNADSDKIDVLLSGP